MVFSDLQCPYCKGEAEMLRKNLIQNYPTQVRLYFKDYPARKPASVGQGCRHGRPLRLPAKPEAFWDFHDWVFEHQDAITADNLKDQVLGWAKDDKDWTR